MTGCNKFKSLVLAAVLPILLLVSSCGSPTVTCLPETSSAVEASSDVSCGMASVASDTAPSEVSETMESQEETEQNQTAAQKALQIMTLREKIGQLFVIHPEHLDADNSSASRTTVTDSMRETLKAYPVGGVCLFESNITSPEQLTAYISSLQNASPIGMLISTDEEGGRVARIAGCAAFGLQNVGNMQSVGATGDTANAFAAGKTIGAYLKKYGVNFDLAPVCDVNTNPDNIVIGSRSFGSEPYAASDMAAELINGLHSESIITSIKHFPGHGDTSGDTHNGYVSVNKTWDELKSCELIPFVKALKTTDTVMMAHVLTPNITNDGLPASLSYEMITGKLRTELGFDGVVLTDSLGMGAINLYYKPDEAALKAISAGIDILLTSPDFRAAFDGIEEAVKNGTLSEERLDESVLRILRLKEKYGILK